MERLTEQEFAEALRLLVKAMFWVSFIPVALVLTIPALVVVYARRIVATVRARRGAKP
jgi:hypothetical protein